MCIRDSVYTEEQVQNLLNEALENEAKEAAKQQAIQKAKATKAAEFNAKYERADERKSTSLLKKWSRDTYGVDARVKKDSGSMYSSINVYYNNGPSLEEIEPIIKSLQHTRYNVQEDYHESKETEPFIVDGFILTTHRFSSTSRTIDCLLYTSPSPRDATLSRMPSSA